jgi:hypothetical protein
MTPFLVIAGCTLVGLLTAIVLLDRRSNRLRVKLTQADFWLAQQGKALEDMQSAADRESFGEFKEAEERFYLAMRRFRAEMDRK